MWLFVGCILGVGWVSYLADLLWLASGFDLWLPRLVWFCGFWYLCCVRAMSECLGLVVEVGVSGRLLFSSLLVLFGVSVGWVLSGLVGWWCCVFVWFGVVFAMCFSFFSFGG